MADIVYFIDFGNGESLSYKLNPSLYLHEVCEVTLAPVEQLREGGHETIRARPTAGRVRSEW